MELKYYFTIASLLLILVILVLKYIIFKKYRSHKNQQHFLKSFVRWYTRSEHKAQKLPASKKMYMKWNNRLNLFFWSMFLLATGLILYCYFELLFQI